MNTKVNVIFFGSSSYSLPILHTLKQNYNLTGIITKSDQPIEFFAQKNNIPFFTPKNKIGLNNLRNTLMNLHPDIAVVADYGLIIPKAIFSIPEYKTLNIHFSKLPELRGASPVQFTILLGKPPWISVIKMDETMDTGGIIWQKSFNYDQDEKYRNETTGSLYTKLFEYISAELPAIINDYIKGKSIPKKQDDSHATYTKILKREDGFVPWEMIMGAMNGKTDDMAKYNSQLKNLPAIESLEHFNVGMFIDRMIRAFTPWPGVWTVIRIKNQELRIMDKRLKILEAHVENDRLVLDMVQLEGKNPVTWKQFKEGHKI